MKSSSLVIVFGAALLLTACAQKETNRNYSEDQRDEQKSERFHAALDRMNKKYGESTAGVLPLQEAIKLREAETKAAQPKGVAQKVKAWVNKPRE